MFLGQIYTILTTPPGNLVYHIVLVFSLAAALQGAIHLFRSSEFPQARRIVVGLGILIGLQMILFIVSGLVWQGSIDSQSLLPPLDRMVTTLALIWIVWLWAFPEPSRLADSGTLFLSLLAMTVWGVNSVVWFNQDVGGFNQSAWELTWQVLGLLIALLGIITLVVRQPNGWSNGVAMLGLEFIGHLISMADPMAGDFPGALRLAQLAMFPMLMTLPQRFSGPVPVRPVAIAAAIPVAAPEATRPVKASKAARPIKPVRAGKPEKAGTGEQGEEGPAPERRRYSTDPKTFHALMSLAAESEANKLGQAVTRGIAQAMLADLCFLITVGENESLNIVAGYDLIREESLGGTSLSKDSAPLLANAIRRGRPLRLPASSTSSDLQGLSSVLGLSNVGHLLGIPISTRERGPLGCILILSPYSNRLWSAEDQAYLSNVSTLFIPILERGQKAATLQVDRDRAIQEFQRARDQSVEVKKKYEETVKELDGLRDRMSQSQVQAENMAALVVMQEEAQRAVERLQAENEQLRGGAEAPSEDYEQMEADLRQTLQEMARMQNSLAEANKKILELEQRPSSPITSEQLDVIASISQELRQPMSSIVGYTDLLLGESVGILGALQRKFVERIKASTERIGGLVDDLIQITNLEAGKREFKSEPIDLNLIIDNAMAYTSTQIREKNITLRLDIPDETPPIQTDRDAFQQVLIHLLQNATAATQAEGAIVLRVRLQEENGGQFLSIQVTDGGGGIDQNDVPLVFARRYRAEHSLIQGLGDTGVGLSIAKTLVEAQSGRIWVETEAGIGSTFSVLIPVLVGAV